MGNVARYSCLAAGRFLFKLGGLVAAIFLKADIEADCLVPVSHAEEAALRKPKRELILGKEWL